MSVVMPVWQPHPVWLREAVESVLAENELELELIVVDDGCPEPVAQLLESVASSRLHVVRVEHGGPYRARNAGIARARGRYVRFADADDVFAPASTGRLLALSEAEPRTIAYGATVVCDEALRPVRTLVATAEGSVERECLLGRFDVRIVSMLFPKAVVEDAGEWDPSFEVSGDWDFVLRAVEQAPARGDGVAATYYRRHGASVTRTADVAAGEVARRRIVERYFERHPDLRGTELERRALAALYRDRAVAYAYTGELATAFDRLWRAARLDLRRAPAAAAGLIRATALRSSTRARP